MFSSHIIVEDVDVVHDEPISDDVILLKMGKVQLIM